MVNVFLGLLRQRCDKEHLADGIYGLLEAQKAALIMVDAHYVWSHDSRDVEPSSVPVFGEHPQRIVFVGEMRALQRM